ncbi:hypothetical protein [Micromonospora maritima]|uniref:hypothetical protein n=1 Tax=Micromonospora maritima TaxID=986711 RepID=UPI00157C28DE|nr:hypothetical protein [Micromonospora maritima]
MAHLGTFGAAQREARAYTDPDTFEFCGERFEVKGEIPPMLMLQLGAAASEKIEQTEGMAALWEAVRCSLTVPEREVDGETRPADPSEFQRFYRLAVSHSVPLEELIRLAMALFELQGGRPTEQRPASAGGPLPTSTPSRSSSSVPPVWPGMTPVDQVLAG